MKASIVFLVLTATACKTAASEPKGGSEAKSLDNPFKPQLHINPFVVDDFKIDTNGLVDASQPTAELGLECHKLGDLLGGNVFEVVQKTVPLTIEKTGDNFRVEGKEEADIEAMSASAKATCAATMKVTLPQLVLTVDFLASDTFLPFSSATAQIKKNLKNATLAVSLEPSNAATSTVCSRRGKFVTEDNRPIKVWSSDQTTQACP